MRWNARYVAVFAAIQLASFILAVAGIIPIVLLATLRRWTLSGRSSRWMAPAFFNAVYGNDEDGLFGPHGAFQGSVWHAIYWSGYRNNCGNMRFLPGISGAGRPFSYWTWKWFGRQFYAKVGWEPGTGWPSISMGGGRGF